MNNLNLCFDAPVHCALIFHYTFLLVKLKFFLVMWGIHLVLALGTLVKSKPTCLENIPC